MDRLLRRNDIFHIKRGMVVNTAIPVCYIYRDKPISTIKVLTDVPVGYEFIRANINKSTITEKIVKGIKSQLDIDTEDESDEIVFKNFAINLEEIIEKKNKEIPKVLYTSYLIGEYEVINTVGVIDDDYSYCDHHVFANKIDDPSIHIDFYQNGNSKAIILPHEIELISEE